jgi:hypothetical protein
MMSFFYQTETADEEDHAASGFPAGSMDCEDPSYIRGALLEDRAQAV